MAEETKIIRIVVDSSKAVEGGREAQRALEAIEKQTAATANSVARIESGFDMAALIAKLTGGFYVVKEFADKMFGVYTAARDAASGMADFAEQLGVSTDFIQGSTFAAAQHTVAVDKMGQGYTKASQLIGQAAQGQKAAIDVFNAMGVKLLDNTGKLRGTESILQDSAAALLRIDDPARRVALSMDLFGKSGAQLIPILADIASGADVMASKASQAGALIDRDTLTAMGRLKSHSEETAQKWNALVATMGAPIATAAMEAVDRILGSILGKLREMDAQRQSAAQGILPENEQAAVRGRYEYWRGEAAKKENRNNALVQTKYDRARQAFENMTASAGGVDAVPDADERAEILRAQNATQLLVSGTFPQEKLDPEGAGQPADKAAGEGLAEKIKKQTDTLRAAAAAQDDMTAAARRGDQAFIEQQAHSEALSKAIEIYGGKLDATNPKVQALAGEIESYIKRTKEGAAAQAFAVATTELEKQNTVLEAQIRLMNEAPEVQAREIALIKARQEAEKGGQANDAAAIEARRKAIEQNETLKTQAEQLKQAQELWTEPLKQAFRSIQQAGADAWDNILQTGNFTFQSLGDVFKTTIRRMAAEFLALATIRPVMSMAVQVIGPGGLGLIGGNTAAQLGFPTGGAMSAGGGGVSSGTSSAGFGGGLGNLGGLSNMFGGSGTGFLSGVSNWLNTPFAGGFAGITNLPAGVAGPAANTAVGGLSSGSFLNGLTPGSALGGLGSIGMGAYSLFGGNGGVGSKIGGAAQIAGGVMMMIPGLQPFGAALSLLGGLGGLLGGGGPQIPPMPALDYSGGGFVGNGAGGYSAYTGNILGGGSSLASQAGTIGNAVLKMMRGAGLTANPGALIGGELESGVGHTWNGQSWQSNPYTQTSLQLPGGAGIERLTYLNSMDMKSASEYLLAQVFKANVLRGGFSGSSDSLKTALTTANPTTEQSLTDLLDFIKAFDQLGKAANPVKDAIDKLNDSFGDMAAQAQSYGLSVDAINTEQAKQTKRTAQDFIDNMLDPLAVQLRALQDEQDAAMASAQYIKDNIEGVYVDTDKIATYYLNKRAALENQYYQGAVDNLTALIQRLTYGDLANASPDTSLTGTRASYTATLAQARAGDATAIANLSGVAEVYAQAGKGYFASGPEQAALVEQMRRDLQEVQASITGSTSTSPTSVNTNDVVNSVLASNAQASAENQQLKQQMADLTAQVAELTAALKRSA